MSKLPDRHTEKAEKDHDQQPLMALRKEGKSSIVALELSQDGFSKSTGNEEKKS